MNKTVWIIVAAVAMLVIGAVSGYNNLVNMSEKVNSKWSQIGNQLQRRADLIPNLVSMVQGYAAHEQQVIQAVTEARTKLVGVQGPHDKAEANGELNTALSRLLMITENYPNLKADKNFRALMIELAETENRIAMARKDYNESVQLYNTTILSLPSSLFAKTYGFNSIEYFKADEGAKPVPQIKD